MSKYIICWKSNITGFTDAGSTPFSKEDAEEIVEYLNKAFPEITHWIELEETYEDSQAFEDAVAFMQEATR